MNAGRLINMALRALMRARRQAARRPGGPRTGGDQSRRKLRTALRFGRLFRRF